MGRGPLAGKGPWGFNSGSWDIDLTGIAVRAAYSNPAAFGESLGPELFSTFGTVTAPWTAAGAGAWSIDGSQGGNRDLSNTAYLTSGRRYRMTVTVVGGPVTVFLGEGTLGPSVSAGTTTLTTESATQTYLIIRAAAGVVATVSAISVREVTTGWLLPGLSAARLSADSMTGPRLVRVQDGSYEWAAHNLLLSSEQFDSANWSKTNAAISNNSASSPVGTMTADKLVMGAGIDPNSATANGLFRIETVAANTYTYSVYAKAAEFSVLRVREGVASGSFLDVNLLTGAITNPDPSSFVNPIAVALSDGWWRVSFTSYAGVTTLQRYVYRAASTGDGTSGILIWGAQVNIGPTATAYVPTTTAARYAPPVEHDGTAWGVRGEPAATNLLTWASSFDNAAWSKNEVTVSADAVMAPDGTVTADTITAAGTAINAVYREYGVLMGAGVVTASIYAKAGTKSVLQFGANSSLTGTENSRANFDLSTGALGSVDSATLTASMVSIGDGWYRCIVSWTRVGTAAANGVWTMQDTTTATREATSSAGDMHLWHAQYETGSIATSPIPTFGAAVTRTIDTPDVPFVPGGTGTVVADFVIALVATADIVSFDNGTSYATGSGALLRVIGSGVQAGGNGSATDGAGTVAANVPQRAAMVFQQVAPEFSVSLNGSAPATIADSDYTGVGAVRMRLANGPSGSLNGRIRALRVVRRALPNVQARSVL
jgi:hypothetical protein